MLLRRRRAGRDHARRRGAGRDPARREQAGARAREQDRRPARERADALEFHRLGLGEPVPISAMHGHGTGDLLDEIVARCPGEAARGGRRGGDPRRDPRPAERRQVEPAERAPRAGARDRLRGARDDARRDRHHLRARRADVRARRHGRAAPQAQAAPGDRVLLGAARARGGGAGRRRARPDRRVRGHRRPGPRVADVARKAQCSTLVVLSKWDIGTVGDRGRRRPARAPPPPAPAASSRSRRRPAAGSSGCSTRSRTLYEQAHRARSRRRELNRFLGELRAAREPPSKGGKRLNLLYGDAGDGRARRASGFFVNDPGLVTRDYGYWVENELRERFDMEGVPGLDRLRADGS